jgi:hypothetical protein
VSNKLGSRDFRAFFSHVVLKGRHNVIDFHGQGGFRRQCPVQIEEIPALLALKQRAHLGT